MTRPPWDIYFLSIVEAVGKRGSCDRGRSGAIIVKDKKILTTGYVGSPPGFPHCDELGHLLEERISPSGTKSTSCIRSIHAELNTILQAAEFGISVKDSTIYCSMTPCANCAMAIIRVGITRVVAKKRYHSDLRSIEMFRDAGIILDIIQDEVEEY